MKAELVDEDKIYSLCYVSDATYEFESKELAELVSEASLRNQKDSITGFLSFQNKRFFQYLEGTEECLNELMVRIEKDSRHLVVKQLCLEPIKTRRYNAWSMMTVNPLLRGISSLIESLFRIVLSTIEKPRLDESVKATLCALLDCLAEDPLRSSIETDVVGRKIIAIGASAGGIKPIKTLLAALPKDIDASILLVLHLAPNHKTVLDEILQRDTGFKVTIAEDGDLLLPSRVYLIPPNKKLEVVNGRLRVSDRDDYEAADNESNANKETSISYPIDVLFSSIANQYGKRVIGIILSGSGNDGTRGAKALQEAGAIVLAQQPDTSEFDCMPKAVIAADAVNRIMEPEQMAPFIKNLVESHVSLLTSPVSSKDVEICENILSYLASYGIDFTGYKRQTLYNRLHRRRALVELKTLEQYFELLLSKESEILALKNDLLICVTDFFRDYKAWENLKITLKSTVFPALSSDEIIRVWVPGCATGEEAYSVAIMLLELLEEEKIANDFKIFATDLSEDSLETAASGIYRSALLKMFDESQLERYFREIDDRYQVSSFIREKVIVTKHNVVSDAPFTNLHMVCCRNLIIYMEPELQAHVLKVLHFSLLKGGVMFLGPSESIGGLSKEFHTHDREWNIHSKKRDKRIPLHLESRGISKTANPKRKEQVNIKQKKPMANNGIYQVGLESLCCAQGRTALVLNSKKSVELVISDPNGILEVASGQPGTSIDKLVVSSLVPTVIVDLQQLIKTNAANVTSKNVLCTDNHGDDIVVDLEIIRISDIEQESLWLMSVVKSSVEKVDAAQNSDIQNGAHLAQSLIKPNAAELETTRKKLEETQRVLFETVRELELSNIEQQDAFEQLTAANEELQSTNEELQSVNEELYTVNFEYQSKIHELSDLTNDMNNLMQSTDLGVVFIDSKQCIRRFTEQASMIAELTPSDIDRPVARIAQQLEYPSLKEDVSHVISLGKSIEKDIAYRGCAERLHVGIYPYKVDSDYAQGAILTMLDLAKLQTFAVDTTAVTVGCQDDKTTDVTHADIADTEDTMI